MTLTVAAVADSSSPPRVLVSASSSPAVTDGLMITRTHEDGSVHRVLTDTDPVMVTAWAGYDYACPFNQVVTYTVDTGSQQGTSSSVFLVSDVAWLIHPSNPALSMPAALLQVDGAVKFQSQAKTYQVLNRRLPVARSAGPRGGESGNLRVKVLREDESAARDLFAAGGPVLLNGPWGGNDFGWKWILPGDLSITNPGPLTFPHRWFDMSYVEVSEPDVNIVAPWDVAALAAAYADCNAAAAAFTDVRAMALGPG